MLFREMTRKNRQLPPDECISLLQREKRGVLSVLGEGGFPYGMPMNHFYCAEDGCLYFHCGKQKSHRMDALRRHPLASFCTFDAGEPIEGDWALSVRSVIVFGRIEVIGDQETVADISARLSRKFTQDEDYIRREINSFGPATLLLRLTPEHISGKTVKES